MDLHGTHKTLLYNERISNEYLTSNNSNFKSYQTQSLGVRTPSIGSKFMQFLRRQPWNCKCVSRSIQFFLTFGQNNIQNKIPFFFQTNKLRINFMIVDFESHLAVTLSWALFFKLKPLVLSRIVVCIKKCAKNRKKKSMTIIVPLKIPLWIWITQAS